MRVRLYADNGGLRFLSLQAPEVVRWVRLMVVGCRLLLQVQWLGRRHPMFAVQLHPLGAVESSDVIGSMSDDVLVVAVSALSASGADNAAGAFNGCPSPARAPAAAD